jgi:hypothetical protein
MNPNRCSPEGRERPPGSPPDRLAALAAVVDDLAAQDLAGLPDGARAQRVLGRRLLDRLEGQWLGELAGVDGCGAAGAEQGIQAASTAGWLRGRPRMGAGAASSLVRTARALFTHPTDDNRPWSEPAAGAASCRCPPRTPTHRARWAPGARTTPTQVPGEKMGPKDPTHPPCPASA